MDRQSTVAGRSVSPGVLGLALVLSCTSSRFRDPSCQSSGGPQLADATLGFVALFTEAGDPIELPNAVVSCTQGPAQFGPALYQPEFGVGAVLDHGAVRVVIGAGGLLNYYTCGLLLGGPVLRRCAEPLRVRVQAPGCEPYDGSFTWDENYDLNGPAQTSFLVPVRLRCAADAGADPSMRDIPALNRDSGNLARDAGTGFDASP